jgi:hypothetical protein
LLCLTVEDRSSESFSVATEKGNFHIGLLYDGDVSSLAPILAGSRDGREMFGE